MISKATLYVNHDGRGDVCRGDGMSETKEQLELFIRSVQDTFSLTFILLVLFKFGIFTDNAPRQN